MQADKAAHRRPDFKTLVDDFDQAWPNVPRTRDLLEVVQAVSPGSAVGNPGPTGCVIRQRPEARMSIIGARKDDWRPDRADVHPGWWIVGFIGAAILYFAVAELAGHLINGNGSPFLS